MTLGQMVEQIKIMLGYPSIDLEITNEQLVKCVENAITMAKDHIYMREFKTFGVVRDEKQIIPYFSYCVDLSDVEFDAVTNVYRGDLLTPYQYDPFYLVNYADLRVPTDLAIATNIRSNMEALINRSWKVVGNKLYVDKFYNSITIEYIPKVFKLEQIDDDYWVGWIMRYALAVAKQILSRIRGKFVVDSNPFKTDADTLASESTSEMSSLLEEIQNRGFLDIRR